MRNRFGFSTNWAPIVLLPLQRPCANGAISNGNTTLPRTYAALNEAEADSWQTIQPPDALLATREAAALSSLPA